MALANPSHDIKVISWSILLLSLINSLVLSESIVEGVASTRVCLKLLSQATFIALKELRVQGCV